VLLATVPPPSLLLPPPHPATSAAVVVVSVRRNARRPASNASIEVAVAFILLRDVDKAT
jgi:hypothetical protein